MKEEQQTLYVSPKVKTVEIKAQAVICQSLGSFYNPYYNDPFGEEAEEI